ncbi:MAG: hypothetical protein IJF83_03205 [Methanobrevibacter sp.]|nr:hypothetical protein [Methanobrevibacter sp.]
MNSNERYRLIDIHGGYIVVDTWADRNMEDKYEYLIISEPFMREMEDPKRYTMEDLIAKLNEYNYKLNGEYSEGAANMVLLLENQVYPKLEQLITEKINHMNLHSTERVKVNFVDLNFNSSKFDKYEIKCDIIRSDESGYAQPCLEDHLKSLDQYTITKCLLKINQYLDNCKNESEKLLLLGLRAELMTME